MAELHHPCIPNWRILRHLVPHSHRHLQQLADGRSQCLLFVADSRLLGFPQPGLVIKSWPHPAVVGSNRAKAVTRLQDSVAEAEQKGIGGHLGVPRRRAPLNGLRHGQEETISTSI